VLVRDIGARGSDALPVTVAADGEVSVGPEPIGHLSGFDFRVDPNARLADKRLLLAAAERRLGDELDRRAKALVDAEDHAFELTVEESGGLAVAWEGHILARLAPGRSLLEPALRTARALDRVSAPTRAALRERLERWLDAQIDRHLRPLKDLAAAATDPASSPGVRALAAMLADAGGVLPRKTALSAIAHLEQADRQALHRLRVRLGPLDVFLPLLLKPAAQHWRAGLLAVKQGQTMPALPPAGAATLTAEADPRGATLAYRRLGPTWIRIDLADRLASHARKVRSAGGDDPVDQALATSIGLDEEALSRLMNEIGFTRAGEAWKWRGRRAPHQDRRTAASHAFAELAKLKKK
jgi:ATP-dependent RNA helicase SUPV3L1/SUV3